MRFDRHENFISPSEHSSILEWFERNKANRDIFAYGISRGKSGYQKRLTTRQAKVKTDFPQVVYDVFDRITEVYGEHHKQEFHSGNSGVLAVITKPEGDTYLHTDPGQHSMSVVTFNILIQQAESGGELFIGDHLERKELKERELHCYEASEQQHKVSKVEGRSDRFLIIFRLLMPLGAWEKSVS